MSEVWNFTSLVELCAAVDLGNGWKVEAIGDPRRERIGGLALSPWFIRIRCDSDKCNVTGEEMSWTGRKWYVSPYSTRSEVVQTILKAYLTALEHEAREKFTFGGVAVFDPHLDLLDLRDALKFNSIGHDTRRNYEAPAP